MKLIEKLAKMTRGPKSRVSSRTNTQTLRYRCRVFAIQTPSQLPGIKYMEVWDTIQNPFEQRRKGLPSPNEPIIVEQDSSQNSLIKRMEQCRKQHNIHLGEFALWAERPAAVG